jgi:deoxyribose-phosphate aldolase
MINSKNTIQELHFIGPETTVQHLESWAMSSASAAIVSIIVPPLLVKKAVAVVTEKQLSVATIIGFPHGFNAIESKLSDIILAMVDGASEMLVALNITALKNGDWQYLAKELSMLLQVVKAKERKLSIAVNAALLTNDEIIKCCDLYGVAGIDSFTLNTDDSIQFATAAQIKLFRQHLADVVQLRILVNNYDSLSHLQTAGIDQISGPSPVK